jgi:phosphorylase/glycogen(starch) synthase
MFKNKTTLYSKFFDVDIKKDFLFEISFEVANKVGGIYTVLRSKAPFIIDKISSRINYITCGIYKENNREFLEVDVPIEFKDVYERLKSKGIILHFGKWIIEEEVNCILFEFNDFSKNTNEIKTNLWKWYGIDSLNTNWFDYDMPIVWSYSIGVFIEELNNYLREKDYNNKIIVHAHEWLSCGSVLYLEHKKKENIKNLSQIYTIFTTHATMLGRSLCASGINLYELEKENINFNFDKKSYELNVYTKHQTEKSAAKNVNFFSTVSDITAKEAEILFNVKARLLYNGFDNLKYNSFCSILKSQAKNKDKIFDFLNSFFNPFFERNINFTKSKIVFISGRYEIKNKGFDLFIKTLGKINSELKNINSHEKIIAFFLIPMSDSKAIFDNELIMEKLKLNKNQAPYGKYDFILNNNDNLDIIKLFKENNLNNYYEDNVKIVFFPIFLNGDNNSFNLNYFDVVLGSDLGVFPSYYEPWGYTPIETLSFGVPTITSNYSGFGIYTENNYKNYLDSENFLQILNRSFEEKDQINQLKKQINNIIYENSKKLCLNSYKSYNFSKNYSWEKFITNYLRIYNEILLKK